MPNTHARASLTDGLDRPAGGSASGGPGRDRARAIKLIVALVLLAAAPLLYFRLSAGEPLTADDVAPAATAEPQTPAEDLPPAVDEPPAAPSEEEPVTG